MRVFNGLFLLLVLWTAGDHLIAGSGLRSRLDLPSGGGPGDEEEETPELIVFYGETFEGDGFFWALDKSGSMTGERLANLKDEVTRAIRSLSSEAQFGITAFSSNVDVWRALPSQASAADTLVAVQWVNALTATGATCLGNGVVEALQTSNRSSKQTKRVIVVSDGLPYCNDIDTREQALGDIRIANYQNTPIDTLLIGGITGGREFMQSLASQNGGRFFQVTPEG